MLKRSDFSRVIRARAAYAALFFGACLAGGVAADERPADYAAQLPVTVSGTGPWYRLDVPLSVQFGAKQAELADVRIFNADGQAQAYSVMYSRTQRTENQTETAVKWFPLYSASDAAQTAPTVRVQRSAAGTLVEVLPDSQLEAGEETLRGWLLDASAVKKPLHKLILDWTAEHDGFQHFSIEGSDDLQTWEPWGEGQIARLSFADERIEQTEVNLPDRQARYVRLLWHSPQQAPLLTAARLISDNSSVEPAPLVWSQPFTSERDSTGDYVWSFPASVPVERVAVQLKQTNTLAPVSLAGRRDSASPWQAVGGGLLYRLAQNGQDDLLDQLQLSGQRIQQLKMHVDSRGGGLGDQAPTLTMALRATQIVFLARGAGPFTLAVGNTSVASASLPLNTLIPGYEPSRLAGLGQAKAGELSATQAVPTAPAPPAATDWKRYGLWAILLLGVILLAAMAASLLRSPPAKPSA